MRIKEKICRMIHEAIDGFDFEDAISDALDNINIEDMVQSRLAEKVASVDVEEMLKNVIDDYIRDEIDALDVEDEILTAIEDNLG